MKPVSLSKRSFNELQYLFTITSDNRRFLNPGIGEGSVQFFKPEKGLRVTVWDCSFQGGIELYNQALPVNQQNCFTLAYFPDQNGLEFLHHSKMLHGSSQWSSLFISDASDLSLSVAPATRCRCVSVSFSKDWLLHVLQTNDTLYDLKENIHSHKKLEVFRTMTPGEKEIMEALFLQPKQQLFWSFYIKTSVLKLVCDFLQRLRNEELLPEKAPLHSTLDEVEQYLNEQITQEFAGTKALAKHFSVNESTLKRHFMKKFGITISAYLTGKKMQYAWDLIQQQGISIAEASCMVGYRSVQYFKEAFTKHRR